jgi:hypothetical protein
VLGKVSFVHYEDPELNESAARTFNGVEIKGSKILVEVSTKEDDDDSAEPLPPPPAPKETITTSSIEDDVCSQCKAAKFSVYCSCNQVKLCQM